MSPAESRISVPGRGCKGWLGEVVKRLSAPTISRRKQGWEGDYAAFCERDWRGQESVYLEFVYPWTDGIYVNARKAERRCS